MNKIKNINQTPYILTMVFAIKMGIYYNLISVNKLEIVLIALSILAWMVLFKYFSKSGHKKHRIVFISLYILFSILMFSDVMYFNYYNDTVSIKQFMQITTVLAVPKSFFATLVPAGFILFLDIPIVYYYFKKESKKSKCEKAIKNTYALIGCFLLLFIIIVSNPFKSVGFEIVRKNEFFMNHVNDLYESLITLNDNSELEAAEIINIIEEETETINSIRYNGIAKGKNLIVIQLEAFQNFVIGEEYNNQEITPNINKLIEKDSMYFDKYFFNVGKGNTSDAEFTSFNSIYPVLDGECYRLFGDNTFKGLPWILKEEGYSTFAIHGYKKEFWNRAAAYPNQGIDTFYAMEDLQENEIIGMGISDKSLFKQLIPILDDIKQPFFAFAISLTSHHPFVLDEQYKTIELLEEDKGTKFGNYLETIRYADEAVGQLIADLIENDLYDDTIIALYGDHHGLNYLMQDSNLQMDEFIGRNYDFDEMFRVPLVIHIPKSDIAETISTTGGQIDFFPTIANLMGIEIEHPYVIGQDLVNAKDGLVAFTSYLGEGSFVYNDIFFEISREGIFEGSRAWEIGTNNEVDYNMYYDEYERAILRKDLSKEILRNDLIKDFYQ